jgi:F420H(2)-dependent quinone reductase
VKESELKSRLARYRQIKLSVVGRKSGKTISIPVWFVLEAEKLWLLPVRGSDTQWYRNVLQNPSIRIDAGRRLYARTATHSAICRIGSSLTEYPQAFWQL